MVYREDFIYLVHLLKCALNGSQPEEKPSDVSFENVFNCAMKHDVANLAFYSVEKLEIKPKSELFELWRQARDLAVMRDINQSFAYDELMSELRKANIRALEIQGTVVKKYYHQPDMRTMSDIDFVIDRENLEKVKPILEKLGYECDCHLQEIDAFRKPNINLEFHSTVFDKPPFADCYANAFEAASSDDGITYYYGDDDFYIYNMFHLLKHLHYVYGCGIRRFCDIYVLNRALGDRLDREYISAMYEKYGVADKAQAAEELSESLFGNGEMTDELWEIFDGLMDSAVHGTSTIRAKNSLDSIRNEHKRFVKLRYWFRRIFPPYSNMVWTYPSLDGKKILLPIYYVRRICRIVFKQRFKIKQATDAMKNLENSKKPTE